MHAYLWFGLGSEAFLVPPTKVGSQFLKERRRAEFPEPVCELLLFSSAISPRFLPFPLTGLGE